MAKWVKFMKDHDDRPTRRSMIFYEKGAIVYLPEENAERAVNAGAAIEIERPKGVKTNKSGRTIYSSEFKG